MFERKCPKCNNVVSHTNKYNCQRADKNKKICRKCDSLLKSERMKGQGNHFFGKKHSTKTINMISLSNTGRKDSVETIERKRRFSLENNPMKGKSVYSVWLSKYGKKEADKRMKSFKAKQSKNSSGKGNPMYGKPSPKGSGNGYKGWYKNVFFRSLRELSYLITLEGKNWKSGELLRIPYTDYSGHDRTYSPDFIIDEKIMVEIKPIRLHKSPAILIKKRAAEKYCKKHKMIYRLIDFERIPLEALKALVDKGDVVFQDRYKKRFNEFLLNPKNPNRS